MKTIVVVLFFTLCAFAWAQGTGKYTTRYDNINIDQILKNDRLLRNYVNCLLGKRKCTKDGQELKRVLPDAIHTKCSKCNEVQKNAAKKIINHLLERKRSWWNELEAKYDPHGTYRKTYANEIRQQGVRL